MLEATGIYRRIAEGKDTWTSKDGTPGEREYRYAELQYLGGTHRVRAPFEGGAEALDLAFKNTAVGTEVVVPVRLNPFGNLELLAGGVVRPVAAGK